MAIEGTNLAASIPQDWSIDGAGQLELEISELIDVALPPQRRYLELLEAAAAEGVVRASASGVLQANPDRPVRPVGVLIMLHRASPRSLLRELATLLPTFAGTLGAVEDATLEGWSSAFRVSYEYHLGQQPMTDISFLLANSESETVEVRVSGDKRDSTDLNALAVQISHSLR